MISDSIITSKDNKTKGLYPQTDNRVSSSDTTSENQHSNEAFATWDDQLDKYLLQDNLEVKKEDFIV